MIRALATKELRETIGFAALALVLQLHFLTTAMGIKLLPLFLASSTSAIPFIGNDASSMFLSVGVLLAIVLGFRQSAWESARHTFHFLLHRPIDRGQVFLVKIAVGIALYLAATGGPLLAYAWWASVPGTHASPFIWQASWPSWFLLVSAAAVYLGAFLSGLRPGRWFGSRLWPLAGVALTTGVLNEFPMPTLVRLTLAALVIAALIANILFIARTRDFS